ncbi:hypothetical protein MUK42_37505 [Musa troglodytarum]|uniref:Uncharacterized protein n=1 Tax=Musa troglodytarum TaxID=320322 RepID=A0A9E7G7Z8_9LILI|nr:hypothetical protein MUK42_37505 [Musa troglodytarum]
MNSRRKYTSHRKELISFSRAMGEHRGSRKSQSQDKAQDLRAGGSKEQQIARSRPWHGVWHKGVLMGRVCPPANPAASPSGRRPSPSCFNSLFTEAPPVLFIECHGSPNCLKVIKSFGPNDFNEVNFLVKDK